MKLFMKMSKSVLVIETPTQAYECPLDDRGYCWAKRDMCIFWEGIECPLKPMPNKKYVLEECLNNFRAGRYGRYEWEAFKIGWNACLEEIEK